MNPDSAIAFTPGEPAGIGPDLAIYLAEQMRNADEQQKKRALVCIADPDVLTNRAEQLDKTIEIHEWGSSKEEPGFFVVPVKTQDSVIAGELNPNNSSYVMATLDRAIDGCLNGEFSALVTGPVHKGIINEADIPFTGHTEYLADRCGAQTVVMMLACEAMRVALATTHVPLTEVSRNITREKLERVIRVLHNDLQQHFGISDPVISVCGLNPHAGENGHLGMEEIDSIIPTLGRLRQHGMKLTGPLPADTAFTPRALKGVDAVLAMYHDQGLPVLKHTCFGGAVNVTLGLPFIRTSVDHGTALDLAGRGQCDHGSLLAAIQQAINMTS